MSQNYKFKSLEIAKASQEKEIDETKDDDSKVYEVGDTRTIDFVMLDGTRQNFPYSHYLTSWLGVENEETVIKIFFATHMVIIKGFCLDEIYKHISQLKIVSLLENEIRYHRENSAYIKKIEIRWKGNPIEIY